MGGVVAYEMAQLLRRAGDSVALVIFIDTWPPAFIGVAASMRLLTAVAPGILRDRLKKAGRMTGPQLWAYFRERMWLIKQHLWNGYSSSDQSPVHLERVSRANYRAARKYRPQPLDTDILMILAAARRLYGVSDPRLHWSKLVNNRFRVCSVGAQDSGLALKTPYVSQIAGFIEEAIAKRESLSLVPE